METDLKDGVAKIPLKRIVLWWLINLVMFVVLYFALFQGVEWCSNLIKICVWANFVIWFCVLLAGKKGSKSLREEGFPVGPTINGMSRLLFAGSLAAFGWFGYAGMEITTLISQQITYFGYDSDT